MSDFETPLRNRFPRKPDASPTWFTGAAPVERTMPPLSEPMRQVLLILFSSSDMLYHLYARLGHVSASTNQQFDKEVAAWKQWLEQQERKS